MLLFGLLITFSYMKFLYLLISLFLPSHVFSRSSEDFFIFKHHTSDPEFQNCVILLRDTAESSNLVSQDHNKHINSNSQNITSIIYFYHINIFTEF